MNELVKWMKENFPNGFTLVGPQFERTEKLDFEQPPETQEQFFEIVKNAPLDILKGFGFGKWSTMNDVIKENQQKPVSDIKKLTPINSHKEFEFDIGRGNAPINLIEHDEYILLFPGEWYGIIPDGFDVVGLCGERYKFKKGESDDDIRYGCLPYGITRKIKED